MNIKKILVTGSEGFIGFHVASLLKEKGFEVIPFDKKNGQDLLDEKSLSQTLNSIDGICHLAAVGDVYLAAEKPELAQIDGPGATALLIKIASNLGIKKIIYASTWEVYGKVQYQPLDEDHPCFPVFSTTNIEYAKGIPLKLGPEARVNSTFAGHYDLAAYLAMILSLLGAFIAGVSFGWEKIYSRIFILAIALANLWLLLQTASRVSFIAYLVGISVALLLLSKRIFLVLVLIVSLLTLLSSNELRVRFINTLKYGTKTLNYQIAPQPVWAQTKATKSAAPSTPEPTLQPYTDIVPGEPTDTQQLGVFRSSRVRFDFEWPKAWGAFLRNPISGSGYSSLGLATDNDYLRSLGEVGLFGTFAFGLIFIEIVKRVVFYFRNFKELTFEKTVIAGFSGMIAALLTNATFIDVFEASKVAILFWTFLGILAVTVKLVSQGKVPQGEAFQDR